MKSLLFEKSALLPGTEAFSFTRDDITLRLPAAGGGFEIPAVSAIGERYLLFWLEVQEEHSMAFELQLFNDADAGKPHFTLRFGMMPRLPSLVCIDLSWIEGNILFPGHTPGQLKAVCHGSRIEMEKIARALLVGRPCFHPVTVRLSHMRASDERPAEYPLPDVKLIDSYGQYKLKEWPGKTRSHGELKEKISRQTDLPDAWPFDYWDRFGGRKDIKLAAGSGFFTKLKADGRWHLADPEGCAFFSMGVDCVISDPDCRVDGVEMFMDDLPGRDDPVFSVAYKKPKEHTRGYLDSVPRTDPVIYSFTHANLIRAFGGDSYEQWQEMVTRQLRHVGINTLGNWSDPALCSRGNMPYVSMLSSFPDTDTLIFRDFPDVFNPQYVQRAKATAQLLRKRRDDPFMIGYFMRNEPGWAFVNGLVIADEVLRNPAPTYCRRRLIEWLREKYRVIGELNTAWHTDFDGFSALERPVTGALSGSEKAREDLREFSRLMIDAYVTIPATACRAEDQNHMNLGMRWAWISDPDIVIGWKNYDVFSINCYDLDPTSALDNVRALGVDLPVMIGEFHFGALDRGPTATGLEGVASQKDRGTAYRYYCEHAAAHSDCVGCHYFQCYDQFALGRFDGENYNIGFFDICLQPYPEISEASRTSASRIYDVHSGTLAPYRRKPRMIPMIAY